MHLEYLRKLGAGKVISLCPGILRMETVGLIRSDSIDARRKDGKQAHVSVANAIEAGSMLRQGWVKSKQDTHNAARNPGPD